MVTAEKELKQDVEKEMKEIFPTFKKAGRATGRGASAAWQAVKSPKQTAKAGLGAAGRGLKSAATADVAPTLKKGARLAGRGLKAVGGGALAAGGYALGSLKRKPQAANAEPKTEVNAAVGWMLLFLSIALYVSDVFITKFNGIDIRFFTNLNSLDVLMKAGFLSLFAIVFLIQMFFNRPQSKEGWGWALALDVTLIIIIITGGFSAGTFLHLGFAALMWVLLIKPVKDNLTSEKILVFFLVIDFVALSALGTIFSSINMLSAASFIGNRLIFPFYTLFLLWDLGANKKSTIATVILFILLFSYVAAVTKDSFQFQSMLSEITVDQKEEAISTWKAAGRTTAALFKAATNPFACSSQIAVGTYEECIKRRTAEFNCAEKIKGTNEYTECLNQELGIIEKVSIDSKLKSTEFEFVAPKNAIKSSIFENTQDWFPYEIRYVSSNPVNVILSCKTQKGSSTPVDGLIFPEEFREFEISSSTEKTEGIFCQPGENYAVGDYKIIFDASIYGIQSTTFLDKIFIGEDMLKKRKDEILKQRSIKISPVSGEDFAVFSFSIGSKSDPFIYAENRQTQPITGGIETIKTGKILSVEKVEIDLRDSGITLSTCSPESNFYQTSKLEWEGTSTPAIKCGLNIPDNLRNVGIKYGGTEFVHKKFQADMVYNFNIEKKVNLKVEKSPV